VKECGSGSGSEDESAKIQIWNVNLMEFVMQSHDTTMMVLVMVTVQGNQSMGGGQFNQRSIGDGSRQSSINWQRRSAMAVIDNGWLKDRRQKTDRQASKQASSYACMRTCINTQK
jgi:hypothetical protein